MRHFKRLTDTSYFTWKLLGIIELMIELKNDMSKTLSNKRRHHS